MWAKLKAGSIIFSIFWVLIFALAIPIGIGYNDKARMAPLVISIPGLLLAAGWLVVEIRTGGKASSKKKKYFKAPSVEAGLELGNKEAIAAESPVKTDIWKQLNPFLWLGLLVVMLYILGFLITIPIYIFLYLKVRSHEKLLLSIIISMFAWMALYAIFYQLLHIPLYPGLISRLWAY